MPRTKFIAVNTPSKASPHPHRVVMLGYPDGQILDITGPMEIFSRSARWLRDNGMTRNLTYAVELVGLEAGPFACSSGVRLIAERAYSSVTRADTLIIAGGIGYRRVIQDQKVLRWIRRLAPKVKRLGSVCSGALILAHAGLLEKRIATTHWDDLDELKRISPSTDVRRDAIYVRDDNLYTSAGVTTGMDMALAMVEVDWGLPVALRVAQALVMFLKRPGGQSQFSDHLAAQFSEDDKLRELQLWMLDHLSQDLSVPALALHAAMSERNFARRFTQTIGVSPAKYVSRIRLEAARRRLEDNNLVISLVAQRCGFGTQETMRRTFISQLGVSPSDYRDRFRSSREA